MSLKIGQTDSSRCVIISLDDRRKWIKSDNDPLPSDISVRNKVEAVLDTLWLYTAHQIANEFLRLAESKHQKLNFLSLPKLVYLAHGWSLWLYGTPLLRDPIQTYEYGVLIPSLYEERKLYWSQPLYWRREAYANAPFEPQSRDVIRQVFEIYGYQNRDHLWWHANNEDTPWAILWERYWIPMIIPNEMIRVYFEELEKKSRKK
jgi:uncharacterized phage-associated protein